MLRKMCFILGMLLIACLPFSAAVSARSELVPPLQPDPPGTPDPTLLAETPLIENNLTPDGNPTGDPGANYRYLGLQGISESPFLADTNHLYKPSGIFIDSANNVYVVETGAARVLKYNADGTHLLTLGRAGMNYYGTGTDFAFNHPRDVTLDASGNIWVVEDSRIVKFNSSGVYQLQLPTTNPWEYGSDNAHFSAANGIAADGANRLYVGDTDNNRVQVYNISSGTPVYQATIGPGQGFNQPWKLAADSQNRLYVLDHGNSRVQRCTPSGGTWTCALFVGGLNQPQGIAVGADNSVYIGDTENGKTLKCTSAGACTALETGTWPYDVAVDSAGNLYKAASYEDIIMKYNSSGVSLGNFKGVGHTSYLTDTNHYFNPHVAVDRQDNLLIVENMGHRITKRSPDGAWLSSYGVAGYDSTQDGYLSYPMDAAAGPDGRTYIANNLNIVILGSTGHFAGKIGTSEWGTGNTQFKWVSGIAVDKQSRVFVTDTPNHRVQVFSAAGAYLATLGQTGVPGADSAHFNLPQGIDVDTAGNIYVADNGNCRVQKFNSSLAYVMTFGQAGCGTTNLTTINYPTDTAVDAQGRVYVATSSDRVQVYDASGAYLTTIGGGWGAGVSQYRSRLSVAVDSQGNVYIGDEGNHRVKKYANGVFDWRQININGFGELNNTQPGALEVFHGALYAGAGNPQNGARIWRTSDQKIWVPASSYRFGESAGNTAILDMAVYGDKLYAAAGSDGNQGQIWCSTDGVTWTRETGLPFSDPDNSAFYTFTVFKDALYVSTATLNSPRVHGAEIWRKASPTSTWQRVYRASNTNDTSIISFAVFYGALYAGVENRVSGARIMRSPDGSTWDTSPMTGGFGSPNNLNINALVVFKTRLYATTSVTEGGAGQLWRSMYGTDWTQVHLTEAETPKNGDYTALAVYQDNLYLFALHSDGIQVWQSGNGDTWQPFNQNGFVGSNNLASGLGNNCATAYQGFLVQSIGNDINGSGVWEIIPYLNLPVLKH